MTNNTAQNSTITAVSSIVPGNSNTTEREKPLEVLKAEEALERSAKLREPIADILSVGKGNELEMGIVVAREVNKIKNTSDI